MGYIPAGSKWYLAEIVEQIAVEEDPRYVVHTNIVLIRGDSPDYAKAVELGTELTYSEHIETDEAAIQQYSSTEEELGVFASRRPSEGPNYVARDVLDRLHERFPDLNLNEIAYTQD